MTDVADADSGEEREPEVEDDGEPGAGSEPEGRAERATDEPRTDGADSRPDELVARVAAVDEEAAAEVAALRERVTELEAEVGEQEATLAEREDTIEELESKVKRARADFQNYKRRAKEREEDIRERATEDLVERLLDVRDNLVRALEQDDDVEVRDGVEATLATFDRVLDAENVAEIDPEAGGEVDPERHEVVHRTESEEPEGAIAEVYRPGYEMAGAVLRPAQVTVSEGPPSEDAGSSESISDSASSEERPDSSSDADRTE